MRRLTNILVTGGAGFIGSNFVRFLLGQPDFRGIVVNVDKLTYAGNPESLADIEKIHGGRRYFFEHADICDHEAMRTIMRHRDIDAIVHFAAESHVDRSIFGPKEFVLSNIVGTYTLLEAAREHWRERSDTLFHHVSTDEVFGSLAEGSSEMFREDSPYAPRSPYSASKASSDHLVRAYHHTYGLPVTITNCSNNYGPYQFPEKLVPLVILNILEEKPLPVYGDGRNVRDWLYVEDHAAAVWLVMRKGRTGETYLIGGGTEKQNIQIVELLCEKAAALRGKPRDHYKGLITFVKDRPGHDRRYAVSCDRIQRELGWKPSVDFDTGIEKTLRWYDEHRDWVERVRSGEYRRWIAVNYERR